MAESLEKLNKMWDAALVNSDLSMLQKLVVDNYTRKIDNEINNNSSEFISSVENFFIEYAIVESKTKTIVYNDKTCDNKVLSMGKWKATIRKLNDNTVELCNGKWSDIRVLCHDNLWRISNTVGIITKRK